MTTKHDNDYKTHNDHNFPNYNIQLARTKKKTQKTFKLKNSKWA